MAEFSQQETQEEKTFKSKVGPFARKLADPTPIDTGVAKGHEVEMWNQIGKGILAGGVLVERAKVIKDKVVGDGIMKRMDDVHLDEMLKLRTHLIQTDIENLDPQETVWAFDGRNNPDTPFMIGESDAKGQAQIRIQGKSLEEYDIPRRQKDRVQKHYDKLEKASQKYILETLPQIILDKAKFQMSVVTDKLNSEAFILLSDSSSFEGDVGAGGMFSVLDQSGDIADFNIPSAGEEEETRQVGLSNKTPFTLNLTGPAEDRLRAIFKDFDDELTYIMTKGVLAPKEAIAYQREFTQGILARQFQIDAARNPTGAYLKLIDSGYEFNRDLNWGRKGLSDTKAEKNIQKISLGEKHYRDWMINEFSAKKKQHDADVKSQLKDDQQEDVQDINARIYSDKAMANQDNTLKSVTEEYINTGIKRHVAKELALNWEFKRRAFEAGVQSDAHSSLLDTLTEQAITDPNKFLDMVSTPTGRGGRIVKRKAELHRVIRDLHEKVYRSQRGLQDAPGPRGQKAVLTKQQQKEISDGIKLITQGDIQKMVNTEIETDLTLEKTFWAGSLAKHGDSAEGREYAKGMYFDWDDTSKRFYISDDKLMKHESFGAFRSKEEMARPLQSLLRIVNEEERKLLDINPGKAFLGPKEFEKAMVDYSRIQTDMILAISTGGKYQGPGESVDQFAFQADKFAEDNPAFKKLYEENGISAVLTTRQRGRMQVVRKAFDDLMTMEAGIKQRDFFVKIPMLAKWRDNIRHNKNNGNYLNMYSKKLGMGIQKQLTQRIESLSDPNILNTISGECAVNGEVDQECVKGKYTFYELKMVNGAIDVDKYGYAADDPFIAKQLAELFDKVQISPADVAMWIETLRQHSLNRGGVDANTN